MKKLLFSTAIAVALGVSNLAYAAIDLNDSDPTTNNSLTYATEIDVSASGTGLADSGNVQDLQAELGFSVNAGENAFVRVDLGASAVFTAAPSLSVSSAAGVTSTVSDGGAGASFVIFELSVNPAPGPNMSPTDLVVINVNGITVVSEATVSARYRLFETATQATTEGLSLEDTSQNAYRFGPAIVTAVNDANEDTIDVATASTEFEGNVGKPSVPASTTLNTGIANVDIGVNPTTRNANSVIASLGNLVTSANLVITGDFSAVPLDGNGDPDVNQVTFQGTPATALTASTATFAIGNTPVTGGQAVMTVTGDVEIPDGNFTAVYDVTAAANADTADIDLGVVGMLEKNGSTAAANMVLAPLSEGGAFRNFIRISNNSGIAGRVFLRVRNDVGDSVSFELGDVEGQASTILDANSATSLISNDRLFAAAQAVDPTFELGTGGRNKLRLTVEAEVPSGNLVVENISLANDNTTFSTFQ